MAEYRSELDPMAFSDDEAADQAFCEQQHDRRRSSANGYNAAQDWREMELVRFAEIQPHFNGRPLIKGLLDRNQISILYGEAGCGKTFLALDVNLHVAAGLEWFGRKVTQGAVVYVAAEAGRGIFNRVAAWRLRQGLDDIPFVAVTSPIDLCHATAGDVGRLTSAIHGAAIGQLMLLVIDTVSRALAGGDENAPADMGAFVRSLDQLRDKLSCHVLAIHHCGKEQSRGARDHSLLKAAVDTEIEVVRYDKLKIASATITKQRDGISGDQIAFRLRPVELGRDEDGDPVTSCIVEPTDELPQKRTSKPAVLPASAKIALTTLQKALAEAGKEAPASNHIPATRVVEVKDWRRYHYAGTAADGQTDEARKKAFQRARENLQAAGVIGLHAELVWIIADARS